MDTYDTLAGVCRVIELARELGDDFRVRGVRLDSGDLAALSREARRLLDDAGLRGVEIFASGSLDEHRIAELVDGGAPIAAFGVGTLMGVSRDAPYLDMAYKLTDYAGKGRLKTSTGKESLPGRKQVFRVEEDGRAARDVIARSGEELPGRPLLRRVMEGGVRSAPEGLAQIRDRAADELGRLPERVRGLEPAEPAYPVEVSAELRAYRDRVREHLRR